MPDGDNSHDNSSIIDLIDNAVVADADTVGIPAFELFAARWVGIEFQLHHFILDASSNGIG